jgi:hypothetical protein
MDALAHLRAEGPALNAYNATYDAGFSVSVARLLARPNFRKPSA